MAAGGDSSVIRRSTLRQQIADALRDEVLAGRLPAGRHFTVKEIAEQYGVSATPVREALVDLPPRGCSTSSSTAASRCAVHRRRLPRHGRGPQAGHRGHLPRHRRSHGTARGAARADG